MNPRPPDDPTPARVQQRRPTLRGVAFFVAAGCAFIDFVGWYMAGHGLRPSAVLDFLFMRTNYAYVANTLVGLIALIIGLLPPWPPYEGG